MFFIILGKFVFRELLQEEPTVSPLKVIQGPPSTLESSPEALEPLRPNPVRAFFARDVSEPSEVPISNGSGVPGAGRGPILREVCGYFGGFRKPQAPNLFHPYHSLPQNPINPKNPKQETLHPKTL